MSASLLLVSLLACGAPEAPEASAPAEVETPPAEPAEAEAGPYEDPGEAGVRVLSDAEREDRPDPLVAAQAALTRSTVRAIRPEDGDFREQLAAEHALAVEAGQAPFLQIYAEWCGPCRALREHLGDPSMVDAFADTWIVMVDAQLWGDTLNQPWWGGDVFSVPAFYAIGEDGMPGASIDGHAWGPNTPSDMAPPLGAFFREHGASPEE